MAITFKQPDLVNQVWRRVDDQPAAVDVVDWLNAGQNLMAIRAGAVFPMLDVNNSQSQFAFDDKWAEIPVLYACARFKQADLMYTDADRYMSQFDTMLRDFNAKYEVPPQYMDIPNSQQFTASAGQTKFIITDETYNPITSALTVYKSNLKLVQDTDFSIESSTKTVTFTNACTGGEFVTMRWELQSDLETPPYTWWTNW